MGGSESDFFRSNPKVASDTHQKDEHSRRSGVAMTEQDYEKDRLLAAREKTTQEAGKAEGVVEGKEGQENALQATQERVREASGSSSPR